MKREQVDKLEKLISMVDGSYKELSILSKKSPSDGVNKFKLNIVNSILEDCNAFIGAKNQPIKGFEKFDIDDVPSNSDVVFILSQYSETLEKCRSDNIKPRHGYWGYELDDGTFIRSRRP